MLNERSNKYKLIKFYVKDFREIIKNKEHNRIDNWIESVLKSGINQLISFANGLLRDIDSVKNAAKFTYSNGLVEGHINRLKVIKRMMYGRANFDLLKIKCLYTF